jgi:sugar/nucleoside kinase (ribokinase family)
VTGVVVLGDVFWDHVSDISTDAGALAELSAGAGYDTVGPVTGEAGGGGLQFAVAARQQGWPAVTLLGKVGRDQAGADVARYLDANGVHALLARDDHRPTGRSLIVYFSADRRLMVSDAGANTTLCESDVTAAMRAATAGAALLHVSGYLLVQDERRAVVLDLMAAARDAGTTVALDLVPHDLDRFVDTSAVLPKVLAGVDWLLAAECTARRVLDVAGEDILAQLSDGGRSVAVYPHPSRAVVWHAGARHERSFDYHPGGRSRGQSANSQARLLREFL